MDIDKSSFTSLLWDKKVHVFRTLPLSGSVQSSIREQATQEIVLDQGNVLGYAQKLEYRLFQ